MPRYRARSWRAFDPSAVAQTASTAGTATAGGTVRVKPAPVVRLTPVAKVLEAVASLDRESGFAADPLFLA